MVGVVGMMSGNNIIFFDVIIVFDYKIIYKCSHDNIIVNEPNRVVFILVRHIVDDFRPEIYLYVMYVVR